MKKIICMLALCCAACGEGTVRDSLGLNRSAPDEFSVVSRPPLTVPPEFYLYPPEEAIAHSSVAKTGSARSALFGATDTRVGEVAADPTSANGSEQHFLHRIGVSDADSNIREQLRQDNAADEEGKDSGILETLREPYRKGDVVVDAVKERERLLENQRQGKAPNEGEVETIQEHRGILESWF